MTMKVQEHVITSKRERHPNDVRYPCRGSHEILEAGRKFITSLSASQKKELLVGNLILDEEETAELFDFFQENDIIGLGILRDVGFKSNMYKILKIHRDQDWMECENLLSKDIEEISFQDVSVGFAMGFAEVLYRDEKPFGVTENVEYKISIHYEEDEEKKAEGQTVNPEQSQDSAENQSDKSILDTSSSQESENSSGGMSQSEDKNTSVGEENEEKKAKASSIKWNDMYYAFGSDNQAMVNYIIVTPKKLWDEQGIVSDEGDADPLAEKLGLENLTDSTYGYDGVYTESALRILLKSFGATENTKLIP